MMREGVAKPTYFSDAEQEIQAVHSVQRTLQAAQTTVGGSAFAPFISVARGHSRE